MQRVAAHDESCDAGIVRTPDGPHGAGLPSVARAVTDTALLVNALPAGAIIGTEQEPLGCVFQQLLGIPRAGKLPFQR